VEDGVWVGFVGVVVFIFFFFFFGGGGVGRLKCSVDSFPKSVLEKTKNRVDKWTKMSVVVRWC